MDGDPGTFVVTFDGKHAELDWYAVASDQPVSFRRVVFAHGRSFHDGGWFDTSSGKPEIQIRRAGEETWRTIGRLESYPATSGDRTPALEEGQVFSARLDAPVEAVALRVVGKPAHGDNPAQSFSSCAELQAFAN